MQKPNITPYRNYTIEFEKRSNWIMFM